MYISSPISFPIAKVLDVLLGEHSKSRFMNNDLKALIELHTINALEKMNIIEKKKTKPDSHNLVENSFRNTEISSHFPNIEVNNTHHDNAMGLNQEQANLMISAIDMKERKAIELMIPLKNTFMISFDDALDKFKLGLILDKGFSRIPVYANDNRNDIVGIFYVSNFRYFENQAIDWSRL